MSADSLRSNIPVAPMASSDEHSVTAEEPGPAPTHSTKHELQIKPDEQGLWRNKEGILWPVLVLRNELVPNMMRKRFLHEDEVPILLFNKNDMYVQLMDMTVEATK